MQEQGMNFAPALPVRAFISIEKKITNNPKISVGAGLKPAPTHNL
jgi:hypothetical protein